MTLALLLQNGMNKNGGVIWNGTSQLQKENAKQYILGNFLSPIFLSHTEHKWTVERPNQSKQNRFFVSCLT